MAILASELVLYGVASRPEDDTSTVGGAIATTARPFDAQIATPGNLEVLSDGADTRTITVRYRGNDGVIASSGPHTLNGTTPVVFSPAITAERLIEATLSAGDASRTVTLRMASAGATLHTFNPNETTGFRMFAQAVSGAAEKIYYEKVFFRNNNGTLALQNAIVDLTADPGTKIAIGLAAAQGDTATSTNRLTAPAGVTFVEENVDINVPGTNIAAGSAIGVWVRMTLAANNVAFKDTFTVRLRGQSA